MNIIRSPWPDRTLKELEDWFLSTGANLFRKHLTEQRDAILLECAESLLDKTWLGSGNLQDRLEEARKIEHALEVFNRVDSLRSGQLQPESVTYVAGP